MAMQTANRFKEATPQSTTSGNIVLDLLDGLAGLIGGPFRSRRSNLEMAFRDHFSPHVGGAWATLQDGVTVLIKAEPDDQGHWRCGGEHKHCIVTDGDIRQFGGKELVS